MDIKSEDSVEPMESIHGSGYAYHTVSVPEIFLPGLASRAHFAQPGSSES